FNVLQKHFFSPMVRNGEHLDYPEQAAPCKRIFTPGFPISGTFGEMEKVGLFVEPQKIFARKRLLRTGDAHIKRMKTEIRLLQTFRHEYSIPYHGSYSYNGQFHLIFEFCDGNLRDFLHNSPQWLTALFNDAKASKILN